SSCEPTNFIFPADPPAFWSDYNWYGDGQSNSGGDRRWVMSNGPFNLDPGDTTTLYFAIVWSRGVDHFDSVRQLKEDVQFIKNVAQTLSHPIHTFERSEPEP